MRWYVNNGLEITAVYRTIDYQPQKIFEWFVKEVADNRRKGDADKEKALLAEVFKLLGNSAYGKFIEGVERQKRTLYTRDEDEVDKHLRPAWFDDLEEIGDAYKIEMRKSKITVDRPFQIGIVVYQLAKLRMLEFYYEFLDYYPDGHGQHVLRLGTRQVRGRNQTGVQAPVRGREKVLVGLGQVEQPRAWFVQAREAGDTSNRPMQQVLLRGGRDLGWC